MDSCELIELFYNRTYEKFVNKQILDDKNFIVPRQQLINYVHELINIPLVNYIEYLKHREIDRRLEPSDITQFSSFSTCELEMCKALLWANNPGCKYVDIGRLFPNKLNSQSESAYWRYGEIHIKAATQLGLTFEYYNYWYLSCLGYIYPELDKNLRLQLLVRTIIRNRLYQQIMVDILDHDVNPEVYINIFPNYNFKRCLRSVYYYLNICLEICRKEGIKVHNLIKKYESPKEIIKDEEPLETNERIDKYLLEIGRHELISAEEEVELAQKIRWGDINARNRLVSANMRFVVEPLKKYLHKGLEFEDLLHEGFLGLIKAVDLFDETRGFKLINYALWWIRRYLSDAIITDSTTIRYPLNVRILHKKVKDLKVKYENQYGFLPPVTKIEIDDENNHEMISYLDSLPDNLKNTCIPCEDLDIFEDNHNEIIDYVESECNNHLVRGLLACLSNREREIVIRVFGIGVREETLESIGDTFGLTRERVRQIKEKAIKKLREMMSIVSKERNHVESLCTRDKDSTEQNMTAKDAEETQTMRDVKKAFTQDRKININLHEHQNRSSRGNNNVILPSDTSKETSSKGSVMNTRCYTVENYCGKCNIYDYRKTRVYSSTGCIKEINNSFFRISLTSSFFSIGLIMINIKGEFSYRNKIILANQHSSLHHMLKNKSYLELIEDINLIEKKVKVLGCWFDEYGNEINKKGGTEDTKNTGTKSIQREVKKQTTLAYNSHIFKWNVGDFVTLGKMFSSPIAIQGDPYFLFRRNVLFVFMKSRTAKNTALNSNSYLLSTDTQIFKKNFYKKYGRSTPKILLFIYESPTAVQFLDEVKIRRIDTNFIRFESLL